MTSQQVVEEVLLLQQLGLGEDRIDPEEVPQHIQYLDKVLAAHKVRLGNYTRLLPPSVVESANAS